MCLMAAVAPEIQPSHGQKRKQSAIKQEHSTITTLHPPQKQVKRRRRSQQEANTAYWDSLSKLWLTQRALDELDQ